MWKSVIRDYPEEQDEQGNFNPLFGQWADALVKEPWLAGLRDLVKWSGTWTGTEEQLMEEIRLRVNREVWESEDFPSDFRKLDKYFRIAWQVGRVNDEPLNLEIFDYRELKKKDLEEFDVPGWGPEAPIVVERDLFARRPSYTKALFDFLLVHRCKNPLVLALLRFTYHSKKFGKSKRMWVGSTTELAQWLSAYYPIEDYDEYPLAPLDPVGVPGREYFDRYDEIQEMLDLVHPSDYRRFHRLMRACAHAVEAMEEARVTVRWRRPRPTSGGSGEHRGGTRWTIEAPYWI